MVAPSTTGTTPSTKRKRDCLESGAKVVQAGKPFSYFYKYSIRKVS